MVRLEFQEEDNYDIDISVKILSGPHPPLHNGPPMTTTRDVPPPTVPVGGLWIPDIEMPAWNDLQKFLQEMNCLGASPSKASSTPFTMVSTTSQRDARTDKSSTSSSSFHGKSWRSAKVMLGKATPIRH
ncbi:unnamed protein product [Lupinus luteus]|uniref:Uncharacterized protein n=1 Tax=Lupinus luteus TaxID=3873 RepID=A0AAV1VYN5_LUPLU